MSDNLQLCAVGAAPRRDNWRESKSLSLQDYQKLYFECTATPFDFVEETLTGDWNELRKDVQELGITPTAS